MRLFFKKVKNDFVETKLKDLKKGDKFIVEDDGDRVGELFTATSDPFYNKDNKLIICVNE